MLLCNNCTKCQWEVVNRSLTIAVNSTISFKGLANSIAAIAMSNSHLPITFTSIGVDFYAGECVVSATLFNSVTHIS